MKVSISTELYGKNPPSSRARGNWTFAPGDGAGHVYPERVTYFGVTLAGAIRCIKREYSGYSVMYLVP